jgi:hypothetical protein
MLALIHKNESIIPASIAGPMRQQLAGGGGGGDVNVRYGNITAMDSRGLKNVLDAHAEHITNIVARQMRKRNWTGR